MRGTLPCVPPVVVVARWLWVWCTVVSIAGPGGVGVAWACPAACTCPVVSVGGSAREVACSGAGLKAVPSIEDLGPHLDPSTVTKLDLSANNLTELSNQSFSAYVNLKYLYLHHNGIYFIDIHAFSGLKHLHFLDLTENVLTEVPAAVRHCTRLRELLLAKNKIEYVDAWSFQGLHHLQYVHLQNNPLIDLHREAFSNLPSLNKLILKEVRHLAEFPSLNGTINLEHLRIDRAALTAIPRNLCLHTPKLKSLFLHNNDILELPELTECTQLKLLDMSNNAMTSLGHGSFSEQTQLRDLLLSHNQITHVPSDAFIGLQELHVLNLEFNQITEIEPGTFEPLVDLKDVNLGNNQFPELPLPEDGLQELLSIKVHNNPYLRAFPGPDLFPKVHNLVLSYAYHCCPFLNIKPSEEESSEHDGSFSETVIFNTSYIDFMHPGLWNSSPIWNSEDKLSKFEALWANLAATFPSVTLASSPASPVADQDDNNGALLDEYDDNFHDHTTNRRNRHHTQCIPQPGPFMPCRDLFDWWTLRCGVWIVFLLALMGNGVVVVVLVSAYTKMDVPRFLVANLAMADFFMGLYLGFLAVVDASTLGEFRMYAIPWQLSPGCQLAGFLGVLSCELSVYTLAVITMERNYAITHAMHLNKRLSLRQAAYIMLIGWVFALTMAVLPLAGVSDYRKFAVCLPFETDGAGLGYIVFLMVINGVAFLILMGCYFKIYCAIRGSQAWNSNDSRIAKRMALLVFTDFLCWAPIAFFSLTAAFNLHLISLEEAKVFTVFILPLNSCCNPFLYALLTKQFKKDCVMLCKTIEESRVTRGIGRCRHSSNFSNRQTPANTNSAVEHSSQPDKGSCSCSSTRKEEPKKRPPGISLSALKYLLCHKGTEEITSYSDSSNPTVRSAARLPRHTSLSSDTYSGSWSDSWRKGRKATTLKLMDRRRHNSWSASHKPSQESSLSNSRPDSSATSASTATWRFSRSSVSSEASTATNKSKPDSNSQRLGSIKDRGKPVGLRQATMLKESSRSTSLGRGKGKLQRQTAVESDSYIPEVNGTDPNSCPLHLNIDRLSCVHEVSREVSHEVSHDSYDDEDDNIFIDQTDPIPDRRKIFIDQSDPIPNRNLDNVIPGSVTNSMDMLCSLQNPRSQKNSPLRWSSPPHLSAATLAHLASETTALIAAVGDVVVPKPEIVVESQIDMGKEDSDVDSEDMEDSEDPQLLLETHFPMDVPRETKPLI